MPSKTSRRVLPWQQLSTLLQELQSSRKPARVVTTGGITPRGNPPSWKCENPQFQSLIEEDCQRVAEIARSVTAYKTHPLTLDLGPDWDRTRYTPDLIIRFEDQVAVVEVKPESKLSSIKTATRLKKVISALAHHGIQLCLLLDTDVRDAGLQRTLKLLQRERPVRGRFRADIDPSQWDPLGRTKATEEQLARWKHAQLICDDLLRRVMHRDPDELLTAA